MMFAFAAPMLVCTQDAAHWRALAREHELAGRPDHAVIALTRSLVEGDDEQTRRELARLTQRATGLAWTQRINTLSAADAPSLSVAAGRVGVGGLDVRVFDEATGALVAEPLALEAVRVVLDPTGTRIAVLEPTGRESIFEVATGKELVELSDERGPWLLAWSGDGLRVARALADGEGARVCVWDLARATLVLRSEPFAEDLHGLALSADGRFAAVVHVGSGVGANENGDVLVIDVDGGAVVARGLGSEHSRVEFDPLRPRLMVKSAADTRGMRSYDLVVRDWLGPTLPGLSSLGYATQDVLPVSDPTGRRWVMANDVYVVASDAVTGAPAGAPLQTDDEEDRGRFKAATNASALSPDGRWRAISGGGDSVRVWDTVTGRRLLPSLRHGAQVTVAALTSAGRLVTASDDGIVGAFMLDALTPGDTAVDRDAYEVHLAPRSARALVVHERGVVERLAPGGETVWSFDAPARLVRLAVSSDGSTMAGVGLHYGLWTWRTDGAERALGCVSRSELFEVALNGAGDRVAANSREVVYVWATEAPVPVAQWPFTFDDSDFAFDPSGELLGNQYGFLAPVHVDLQPVEPPADEVYWSLALSERGDAELWSDGPKATTVTWRADGRHVSQLEQLLESGTASAVGGWLVSAERAVAITDQHAVLIDPKGEKTVAALAGKFLTYDARLVGDRLALELDDGPLRLFDATGGGLLAEYTPSGRVLAFAPLPGTSDLVVSRTRYDIQVLDALTARPVGEPLRLAEQPSSVRVIDAMTALVGTEDGAMIQIKLTDGAVRALASPSGAELLHVALSPDGQRVACIEAPDVVVLRDTSSGAVLYRRKLAPNFARERLSLGGREGSPTRSVIDFDPTSRWLLVAGYLTYSIGGGYGNDAPSTAEIVDAREGSVLGALEGHDGMMAEARFSADGERLVAWNWKRVQVWETRTGRSLADFEVEVGVDDARFQPGAQRLSIVDDEDGIGVWDVGTEKAWMPRQRLASERSIWTVVSPDGTLAYSKRDEGDGQWYDLVVGEKLCAAEHEGDLAFGPGGRVLAAGSILGRPTSEGFVVEAIRPSGRGRSDYFVFDDRSRVEFIDPTRAIVGGRPTPDGVELVLSDFGPSRLAPMTGTAEALLAEWSTKLGLTATADGQVR